MADLLFPDKSIRGDTSSAATEIEIGQVEIVDGVLTIYVTPLPASRRRL